jgi:hypothetical protein
MKHRAPPLAVLAALGEEADVSLPTIMSWALGGHVRPRTARRIAAAIEARRARGEPVPQRQAPSTPPPAPIRERESRKAAA